jgi:hypothetical protein
MPKTIPSSQEIFAAAPRLHWFALAAEAADHVDFSRSPRRALPSAPRRRSQGEIAVLPARARCASAPILNSEKFRSASMTYVPRCGRLSVLL